MVEPSNEVGMIEILCAVKEDHIPWVEKVETERDGGFR
jgi:hypothetical protein